MTVARRSQQAESAVRLNSMLPFPALAPCR